MLSKLPFFSNFNQSIRRNKGEGRRMNRIEEDDKRHQHQWTIRRRQQQQTAGSFIFRQHFRRLRMAPFSIVGLAKSILVSMLFKLISCQIQGMRIDRILPECFVRRVCHWQRSLINKAMAERLEEGSRWKSPVSILKENQSCSRLLGPTAAGLLNGVEHSTL